jgi:hypothetical protein
MPTAPPHMLIERTHLRSRIMPTDTRSSQMTTCHMRSRKLRTAPLFFRSAARSNLFSISQVFPRNFQYSHYQTL